MSVLGRARSGCGNVFQDVVLDPRPRTLGPRGASPAQSARQPQNGSVDAATSASLPPPPSPSAANGKAASPVVSEATRTFEEGYRMGVAEAEAAQRVKVQEELLAIQRQAFEQGLAEGRQRGLEEGKAAGRQLVEREAHAAQEAAATRIAQLDQLLASLPAELLHRLEQVEDDMVALCHAAICRILGDELVTLEGVAHHVRQAIRETGPSAFGLGQIAIHVHPRDLARLEADPLLAAWLRQHASAGAVHWVADERVKLGGCFVRSAEGSLDARLETQLTALQRLLGRSGVQEPVAPRSPQGPEREGKP